MSKSPDHLLKKENISYDLLYHFILIQLHFHINTFTILALYFTLWRIGADAVFCKIAIKPMDIFPWMIWFSEIIFLRPSMESVKTTAAYLFSFLTIYLIIITRAPSWCIFYLFISTIYFYFITFSSEHTINFSGIKLCFFTATTSTHRISF